MWPHIVAVMSWQGSLWHSLQRREMRSGKTDVDEAEDATPLGD